MIPRVSVIMPIYNGEKYLRESIESILDQTFTDFEIITIDDGSIDGTPAILLEYAQRDSRVHVHTLPQNKGIANARNLGLKLAQGEYLANMDSDDISLPNRLSRQVDYLDNHPEIGVLGAGAHIIDESGLRSGGLDHPSSHIPICWALYFYDPIINPAVMLRRELAIAVGGYREEYPPTEDYDLWARLSESTRLANLPERLLLLRKHSENATVIKRRNNLEQSASISRDMFKRQLGIEIHITPIELAWEPGRIPTSELELLSSAIVSLFEHFIKRPKLTPGEKHFLRRESALQLMRLLRNTASTTSALRLLIRALRIDPLAFFAAANLALAKIQQS